MYTRVSNKILDSGFLLLGLTMFLMSFPRSWSLWPLGLFLGTGLLMWAGDFRKNAWRLLENKWIVMPPVIYFIIHFVSIVIQGGPLNMLTDKLMFILVPVLGLPVFVSFSRAKIQNLMRSYIAGILVVTIILIFKAILIVRGQVPPEGSFFEYAVTHDYWFLTSRLSVLEHPTYLSMKILWILLLLFFAYDIIKFKKGLIIAVSIYISIFLFLLASRASIIFWVLLIMAFLCSLYKRGVMKPLFLFIGACVIIISTILSANKIARVYESVDALKVKLKNDNIDWKDLDQRTREWYVAIQIIKEKPVTGAGYYLIKDEMLDKYIENKFFEEALLQMNAHNQFLEAQMTFGVFGTLSLLLMLLAPLIFRKRLRYPHLMTGFILMISFFLLFESMFNRQWGIMFFLLFYFILGIQNPETEDNITPDHSLL
ncbi:MAG: O-Antigen ligase [Bacteroidetes bacterium ADurb.Bin145]|jgi:O-antigen ligase|nr:MAG: O-Antigen ligase [Bacteroidetes bacterium ADurb.Bin145]